MLPSLHALFSLNKYSNSCVRSTSLQHFHTIPTGTFFTCRLQVLCSRHGAEDYRARVTSGSASILAILDRYTTCMPSAARILELLPAAKPRRYSAASSPLGPSGPSNVRFVLNVVERGLCSGFLDRVGRGLGPACTGVDSSCVDDSGADAASNQDEGAAPASSEVRLYVTYQMRLMRCNKSSMAKSFSHVAHAGCAGGRRLAILPMALV